MIAHWDDVEPTHESEGTIEFDGYDLGEAAGTVEVGVTRGRVKPEKQSSPVRVEIAEEEIFDVLGGSGRSARASREWPSAPASCTDRRTRHFADKEIFVVLEGLD